MDQLVEILRAEGRAIAAEFALASLQGAGTPQEIADFREHALQSFIRRFRPLNHVVSKGKIAYLDGRQSDSIDCLVLNPAHPNLIDSNGKFRIIFADGVDAAIEVKPNLARSDELERSLVQGRSVKSVHRSMSPIMLPNRHPAYVVEHSQRVPFFVFTLKAFDPEALYEQITTYYRKNEVPPLDQLDAIFVSGQGVLKNVKFKEANPYGDAPFVGSRAGWFFEEWGDGTMIGVLLAIEYSFAAVPSVASSIISRVMPKLGKSRNVRLLGGPVG